MHEVGSRPAAANAPVAGGLLRDRAMRWLMGASLLSLLGDQFTLVALPWLVLRLSGDPLALGWTVTLMGVPRAAFILFGGALADRYDPKTMLLVSRWCGAALLGALAALTLGGLLTLPLLYMLALLLGLAQALSIPAGSALLPRIVPPAQLQAANGLLMGLRQLSMLAGPLAAAALMALAGGTRGPGLAFAVDAATFLVSAAMLSRVALRPAPRGDATPVFAAVAAGLAMVWRDRALRTCFAYWSLTAFVTGGALQVALPVLAQQRLGGGAALGMLLGAHGAGTLAGIALSGLVRRLGAAGFGMLLLAVDALCGCLLLPLGAVDAAWQGAVLLFGIGLLGGALGIAVYTWVQQRVPARMLGRAMSLFMFIFMGIGPMSATLAGWLLVFMPVAWLFAACGCVLMALAAGAWLWSPMRTLGAQR
jgi:MFS family permease